MDSGSGVEVVDTDGEQSWLYIEPKVHQTSTAAFDGLYLNATLTSVGTGATGDGNNLLRLGVSGTTKFKIDTTGKAFSTPYTESLIANAVGLTGMTALYGLIVVKDTTTRATCLVRIENAT